MIDISIDGIPLSKSSEKHFWPILGKFRKLKYPFIIAVLLGSGKPKNVNEYLKEFVTEVANLKENKIQWSNGIKYNFRIDHFVLDAKARSFVKQCVSHNGYYACEKCIVRGVHYRKRMCYFDQNCLHRTDESLRNRANPNHHIGYSILEDIEIGMVSQFRLDPLHLVYLDVVKRMLSFLISVRSQCTLPDAIAIVIDINNMLQNVVDYFPMEFTRKPRSLGVRNKREKWKGSEFRRFILYDSIYVLKDHVPTNIYQCFLSLHCAIYTLCRPNLFQELNRVADYILRKFVNVSVHSFGREFVVHSLMFTHSFILLTNVIIEVLWILWMECILLRKFFGSYQKSVAFHLSTIATVS